MNFQKQPFVNVFQNRCVIKNFANFTGKHLCWSPFLIKLQACNFIKKRLQYNCFPVKFRKFLRTLVFTEHLRWLFLNIAFAWTPDANWMYIICSVDVLGLFWASLYIQFTSCVQDDCSYCWLWTGIYPLGCEMQTNQQRYIQTLLDDRRTVFTVNSSFAFPYTLISEI